MKKSFWIKISVLFVVFAAVLALDLVTKYVFDGMLDVGTGFTVIPYLFNFLCWHNTGAAWGILSGNQVGLIILSFVFLSIFVIFYIKDKKKSWLLTISIAFLVAGCLGNLFDRIVLGYVRDFIQFAFWQSFPIFNFADVFLFFGVILFLIHLLIPIFKKKDNDKNNESLKEKENKDKTSENV